MDERMDTLGAGIEEGYSLIAEDEEIVDVSLDRGSGGLLGGTGGDEPLPDGPEEDADAGASTSKQVKRLVAVKRENRALKRQLRELQAAVGGTGTGDEEAEAVENGEGDELSAALSELKKELSSTRLRLDAQSLLPQYPQLTDEDLLRELAELSERAGLTLREVCRAKLPDPAELRQKAAAELAGLRSSAAFPPAAARAASPAALFTPKQAADYRRLRERFPQLTPQRFLALHNDTIEENY